MGTFQRIATISKFLALTHESSLRYLGVLSMENLGDELLYTAIRGYFPKSAIRAFDSPVNPSWLRSICDRKFFRGVVLGGGTLIGTGNENQICNQFLGSLDRYGTGIVFGTGVSGVDFEQPGGDISRGRWIDALSRCSYIGVRGPDSSATLASWGVSHEVLGDPACFFAQEPGFWEPQENRLAVNFGKSDRVFHEVHSQLVSFLAAKLKQGWELEFFVVWPEDVGPTLDLAKELHLSNPVVHKHYYDPLPYLASIRRAKACVGIKLHAVILAFCAGVPAIMLEYNPKCLDFMKSIDLELLNLPIEALDADNLEQKFEHLLNEGAAISQSVLTKLHKFKGKQFGVAQRLYSELGLV